MDEIGSAADSHGSPFPRNRHDVPVQEWSREAAVARGWLRTQERALSDVFLAEGREELPVEDYRLWRHRQHVRLGQARCEWTARLADAGWNHAHHTASVLYLRPDLCGEYDHKHPDNLPELLLDADVKNHLSVWWRCVRDGNHQWRTSIRNRHFAGTGCPWCGKKGVSRREREVFEALQRRLPDLLCSASVPRARQAAGQRRLRSWRVDMLLKGPPAVVVEYDGAYWHRDRAEWDQAKSDDLAMSGHVVVRVREHPLTEITANDVICTEDQCADAIAEAVIQKLDNLLTLPAKSESAGSGICRPPEPLSFTSDTDGEWTLFDRSEAESSLSPRHRDPNREMAAAVLATMLREATLAYHRAEVHYDREVGECLVGEFSQSSVEAALLHLASNMQSVASLTAAAEQMASSIMNSRAG
ncbi:zinc-ribbon domain-containing protein [Nocardia asiatica]|uniref:zinc-ribbon domain-containing protein n=1 Tax=Nocardia asiatica TaxID=209252 RepID=UPI002458D80F|nr:zinc-ribbon domain-containing protein [Nocardia asiatica]